MDKEIKKEARKQYFRYFRVWFILIGILLVIFGVLAGIRLIGNKTVGRSNEMAPTERVYDYADVLSDTEEQKLREHIASCEKSYEIDLILVTINEDVESIGDWDTGMMNRADDFYEEKMYGYNQAYGDGALLLDNWYVDEKESQKGSWLSTSGFVESCMGNYEIDRVLDEVYYEVEDSPYRAYKAYIDTTCQIVKKAQGKLQIPWLAVLLIPVVVAGIYAVRYLTQAPAKDTTTANVYVAGGKPVMNARRDDFIRKSVSSRRIQSSSGSGRSGGGGHHTSRSGRSHGGGGRRR